MNDPAVILVSGWSGPGLEWRFSPIRTKLRRRGYHTEYFHQCDNGWGDIRHNAKKLSEQVRELRLKGHPVHLIGHSMGGLVASWSEHYIPVDLQAQSIITIGTPHRGVDNAAIAGFFSESAKQMDSSSWFIRDHMVTPTFADLVSISCRYDMIVPWYSAIHPLSKEVHTVDHGHMSVIFSNGVAQWIVDYLDSWSGYYGY